MVISELKATSGISMEATPSGKSLPDWLMAALLEGRRLMIIHPSEAARSQAIEEIHSHSKGAAVDTTHHLTLKRLNGILHLDLRLPRVLNDDGILFEKTHRALAAVATDFGFPLLQPHPTHRWSRSRTKRLLSLHKELATLENPWNWEQDPGAKTCDEIIQQLEAEDNATHPARLERVVFNRLKTLTEPPFTISDVEGIIMLDHPPCLNEIQLKILEEISRFTGVHQLVNPGSHRLGYHGEYILDIPPCRKNDDLPNWVPVHDVWQSKDEKHWRSLIGDQRDTSVHEVFCEVNSRVHLALISLLDDVETETLVICGDPDNLQDKLLDYSESIGHRFAKPSSLAIKSSAVSRILALVNLSEGEDAWSLNRLKDLWNQTSLPMNWPLFWNLKHPTEQKWHPRLHPKVLEEIARSFHLLGGQGALSRWIAILSQATPRPGTDLKRGGQELEETLWWISCLAKWQTPLLSELDKKVLSEPLTGCTSHETLPLPETPGDVISWYNSCLEQIDWNKLISQDSVQSNTLPGIQNLTSALGILLKENIEIKVEEFSDILKNLAQNTEIPSIRGSDKGLTILSPAQAYGVEAETIILCGIDAQSWSMKTSQIPWLDDSSRLQLGLHKPDEPLRMGRHHLRHILNSAKTVIIINSSIEEGTELAGPLDEWYSDLSQSGNKILDHLPSFIPHSSWDPKTPNRNWAYATIKSNNRLLHQVSSMEIIGSKVRTHRNGVLARDTKQRAGLATIENRQPEISPLNINGIITTAERELLHDQSLRADLGKTLAKDELRQFKNRSKVIRPENISLIPTKTMIKNGLSGRDEKEWPHLGKRTSAKGKPPKFTLPIDFRPLIPISTGLKGLDSFTGRSEIKLTNMPEVWSQSKLQKWLNCPRQAFYDGHMYLGQPEKLEEDIANVTRGNIIHLIEEALLRHHGLVEDKITTDAKPLHKGKLSDSDTAWQVALNELERLAPWMKRRDGISAHRCRDLIGVEPETWLKWVEHKEQIPIGGRIGRMIISDFGLIDAAPIASEWKLGTNATLSVEIGIDSKKQKFSIKGLADRVDQVLVKPELLNPNADEVIPLDFELKNPPSAKRFVVIRDIKSRDGSKDNNDDERHKKAIFEELQLALYARAWEVANPGDRVIGVGATQVGLETQAHIELDPEFVEHCSTLKIGEISTFTHTQYRLPDEKPGEIKSNAFRAWMRERITTALRVISNAKLGRIDPQPSGSCSFCKISDACPSKQESGW